MSGYCEPRLAVRILFHDQTKSSAVTSEPFDHLPFCLKLKIYFFPSSLIDHDSAAPGKFSLPNGLGIVKPSHKDIKI